MAGWISTLIREPDFNLDVELGVAPAGVLTAAKVSALGLRIKNNGAGIAKINLTNTAGVGELPTDYELAAGAIYSEPLNLKTFVGLKGWADIAGVRFNVFGWDIT